MNKKLLVILTLGFLAITQTADALIVRRGVVGGPYRWRGWRAGYAGWRSGYYGHPYHGFHHRYY